MDLVKETTKKNITINEDMNLDGFHQEEHLILGIKIVSLVTVSQATGFDRRRKIAEPMTRILQQETKVVLTEGQKLQNL